MVTFDPDKKATKRGWFRTIFSPFIGANTRRARLAHRDAKAGRARLKTAQSERAYVKQLKKDGTLK